MKRLTTNKPVREMTMTELAHNGCYRGEDGWARYRDYDTDIDARDFARKLLERYAPDLETPKDTRDLEDMLFDALQFGALDNVVSLIASMYAMMWAMADLREHLAAYEDTGLEPEEIKETHEAYNEILTRTYGPHKQKMDELLNAESEGRLIVLPPCRCGDTLYYILDGKIYEGTVYHIQYDDYHGTISSTVSASLHGGYSSVAAGFDDFGKTVFLSREEAEAALGCEAT